MPGVARGKNILNFLAICYSRALKCSLNNLVHQFGQLELRYIHIYIYKYIIYNSEELFCIEDDCLKSLDSLLKSKTNHLIVLEGQREGERKCPAPYASPTNNKKKRFKREVNFK